MMPRLCQWRASFRGGQAKGCLRVCGQCCDSHHTKRTCFLPVGSGRTIFARPELYSSVFKCARKSTEMHSFQSANCPRNKCAAGRAGGGAAPPPSVFIDSNHYYGLPNGARGLKPCSASTFGQRRAYFDHGAAAAAALPSPLLFRPFQQKKLPPPPQFHCSPPVASCNPFFTQPTKAPIPLIVVDDGAASVPVAMAPKKKWIHQYMQTFGDYTCGKVVKLTMFFCWLIRPLCWNILFLSLWSWYTWFMTENGLTRHKEFVEIGLKRV